MSARRAGNSLACLLLFVTGCGAGTSAHDSTSDGSTDVTSSLSYEQAAAQADAHARESLSVLPQGARLDQLGGPNPVPCSDDDGAPPSTPVSINSDYFVTGLDSSRNATYLEELVTHWKRMGWNVKADNRPADQFVSLEHAGFGVVVQLTPDGSSLGLSTTTPCVTPQDS